MASVNKVILVGNLGADPEVRYLPSGDAVANIRPATTDRYKDKASGEMKEATEWHRVSFFGLTTSAPVLIRPSLLMVAEAVCGHRRAVDSTRWTTTSPAGQPTHVRRGLSCDPVKAHQSFT